MPRAWPCRRGCAQSSSPSRDAESQVGDPFPVAVDLEHRGHPSQVRGDRLVKRQDSQTLLFDQHLAAIGIFFLVCHLADQIKPSVADRLDALLERIDDRGGQGEEAGPERILFPQRMPAGESLAWTGARGGALLVGTVGRHDASPCLEAVWRVQGRNVRKLRSIFQFFSQCTSDSRPRPEDRAARDGDPDGFARCEKRTPVLEARWRILYQNLLTCRRISVEREPDLTLRHVDRDGATGVIRTRNPNSSPSTACPTSAGSTTSCERDPTIVRPGRVLVRKPRPPSRPGVRRRKRRPREGSRGSRRRR